MNTVKLTISLLFAMLCESAYGLDSDADLQLYDHAGDSPKITLKDGSGKDFVMRKLEGNGAEISTTQGPLSLKPSGDLSKSFSFETVSSDMTLSFSNTDANKAGVGLNSTSRLGYRDQNSPTWMNLGWKVSPKTADFAITASDDKKFYVVSNFTTATLPSAASVGADFMVAVKRIGVTGDVVVSAATGEKIEGLDRVRLEAKNAKVVLISDGTGWYKFEEFGSMSSYDKSGTCPTGYVSVPRNTTYVADDFCIAKYEMKSVGGVATSQASLTPWVNISQTASAAACTALGAGYHLVTNEEWMTIARNIENVAVNWSTGVVGSGALNRGHSDNAPANALAANADDTQACDGTGQTCSNIQWSDQRRTHVLSTGEAIWDFAGNVYDWTSWYVLNDKASPQAAWIEIKTAIPTTAMPQTSFYPENALYSSTQGIGQYYPALNGSGGAGRRGGGWGDGTRAGVFSLDLNASPSYTGTSVGFRCAWSSGG